LCPERRRLSGRRAGIDVTARFARLGWRAVAPEGVGAFHPATVRAIAARDPDIIVPGDPAARAVLRQPAWSGLKAVGSRRVYVAPAVPFGWIEARPSINRLIGLAWLHGGDATTPAALANQQLQDRVHTTGPVGTIANAARAALTGRFKRGVQTRAPAI
jgi:hypothetical protein